MMDRAPVQRAFPKVYDGFTVSEAKSVNSEEEHITSRLIILAYFFPPVSMRQVPVFNGKPFSSLAIPFRGVNVITACDMLSSRSESHLVVSLLELLQLGCLQTKRAVFRAAA